MGVVGDRIFGRAWRGCEETGGRVPPRTHGSGGTGRTRLQAGAAVAVAVMASSALGSGSGVAGWIEKSGKGASSGGDDGLVAAAVEASKFEFGGSGADGSGGAMCSMTSLFAGSGSAGAGCTETVAARGTATLVLNAVHGTIVWHTRRGGGVGQVEPVECLGACAARACSSNSSGDRRAALRCSRTWNYWLWVAYSRRRSRCLGPSTSMNHEAAAGTAQPQMHSGR